MRYLKIDVSFTCTTLLIFLSNMDTLTDEILHICAHLSDKDNICLSATSKRLSNIKFRVLFFSDVCIKDIVNLSYFHQFSNVIMLATNESLPKHVTHLTFCNYFNRPINSCVPNSVTNLTFDYRFNQPINSCIPDSVTHLTFGYYFNKSIKDRIPDSVTHLTFGDRFNQKINGYISDSVTYLTFGYYFDQNIDALPISINNISLSSNYKREISEKVLPKVTIRK